MKGSGFDAPKIAGGVSSQIEARPISELLEAEVSASRAQTRYMIFEDLAGAPPVLAFSIVLTGTFRAPALVDSLAGVIRDHDVLRTGFTGSGEHRRLRVWRRANMAIRHVDLRGLPVVTARKVMAVRSSDLERRPLDNHRPPLLRMTVFQLGPTEHVLHLAIHHGLVDETSMRLLVERLVAGYAAACAGVPMQSHSAAPFYRIVSTLESLQDSSHGKENLCFWQDVLKGCPAEFAPPRDREPSSQREMRTARVRRRFQGGMASSLDQRAARCGATRFGIIAAALGLLLARLANSRDVVFAVSVSLRHLPGLAGVVGPLMNTIVLRVNLAGACTLAEATARTMPALGAALAHGDTPLDLIYSNLRPAAASSAPPFAQVLLSHHGDRKQALRMHGLDVQSLETPIRFSPYQLAFSIAADGGDLVGSCDYLSELYDAETVERYLETWEDLLSECRGPDAAAGANGIHRIPESDLTRSDALLARIESVLRQRPDAIAIRDCTTGESVTHRLLARLSDEVARGILAEGVGPGAMIGVQLARGAVLWGAILGVLKAGCACAPLRLHDSKPMQSNQIERGDFALVISERSSDGREAPSAGRSCFRSIHGLRALGRRGCRAIPQEYRRAASIVLSTSGSTGESKWVEIPLAALDATLAAFDRPDLLRGRSKMLSITDAAFDISWLEVFGALYCGGSVAIATEGVGGDGAALAQQLREHEPDMLQATPYTWSRLMSTGWSGIPGMLVLCGGEAADEKLASWLAELPVDPINVYGPTETNIWSTTGRIVGRRGGECLGDALAGETAFALSDEFEPTPPGGVGELHIGGAGLARGYRRHPANTARAFVPDPFSSTPGARMYRTGDLVRLDAKGRLVFRGRTDSQIKLRGFRIELDGVAKRLAEHPSISACVVCCRDDARHGPVLVAYMLLNEPDAFPEICSFHHFARERLPAQCVPAAFVPVASFQATSTGKIDRQKLPAPEDWHFARNDLVQAPRTPTEEGLAFVWTEVLGHSDFGVDDNFFALGGTSLGAIEVTSRIIDTMHPEFTFAQFLDMPTISALARSVDAGTEGAIPIPAVRPGAPGRRVSLSEIFGRQTMRELQALGREDVNVRQVLALKGAFRPSAFEFAIRMVSARHEALRTSLGFDADGPFLQAGVATNFEPDIRIVDVSDIAAPVVARMIDQFVRRGFDLRRAPLFRLGFFRRGQDDLVLALAASHLVVDGWSLRVLAREIEAYYRGCGRPPVHRSSPVQFPDYVAWQDEWLRSEGFAEGLRFWMRRVCVAPPPLFGMDDEGRGRVRLLSVSFGSRHASALSEGARRLGCTPFACALGCTFHALYEVTGIADLAVLAVAANRTHAGVAGMIGRAMNPIVLRVLLAMKGLDRTIAAVWQEVLASNRHQGIPIDVVYDALGSIGMRPNRPPAEIYFLWNEIGMSSLRLPGVSIEPAAEGFNLEAEEVISAPALQLWWVHSPSTLKLTISYHVGSVKEAQAALLATAVSEAIGRLASAEPSSAI